MTDQIEQLVTLMKAMYTHALEGMWETVASLDNERQKLLDAFNPATVQLPAALLTSQVQLIRQIDRDILQLANQAKQQSAENQQQLQARRSHCAEYLQAQK